MIKIRLSGLPQDLETALPLIKDNFIILKCSDYYSNTKDKYVRQYLDVEPKKIIIYDKDPIEFQTKIHQIIQHSKKSRDTTQ